jgi:hypothetical protein
MKMRPTRTDNSNSCWLFVEAEGIIMHVVNGVLLNKYSVVVTILVFDDEIVLIFIFRMTLVI